MSIKDTRFYEKIDSYKLKYIIENYETIPELNKLINTNTDDNSTEAQITLLIKYFKKCKLGIIPVYYVQKPNGRWYSKGSLSLQMLSKVVRHTISSAYYHDIDISNCHPTILSNYCLKHNINCPSLNNYLENREHYFNVCPENFTTDKKKELFLQIINGGEYFGNYEFHEDIFTLYNEMNRVRKLICEIEVEIVKVQKRKKRDNLEGRVLNHILTTIENNILMKMYSFFVSEGFKVDVLVFDGLMIRKNEHNQPNLQECEAYIKTTLDIDIHLVEKEMNKGIVVPEQKIRPISIEPYPEFTLLELQTHVGIANIFMRIYGDENIRVLSKKDMNFYNWNPKTTLWDRETSATLMKLISNSIVPLLEVKAEYFLEEQKSADNNEDANRYEILFNLCNKLIINLKTTPYLINIVKYIASFNIDTDFEKNMNRSPDEIPLKDGQIINLETKQVRKRNRNDLFSFELNHNFVESDYSNAIKFFKSVCCDDEEYVDYHQKMWGYFMTGRISDRSIHIAWGVGRNAKSTTTDIFSKITGKIFTTSLSETALLKQERKGGATPELMPLLTARLSVVNETCCGEQLNAQRIKSLTGNDEISARQLYGEQITFHTQSSLLMLTNEKPEFDINDEAMRARVKLLPFNAVFDASKENGDYINNIMENHLDEFFSFFVEGAYKWYKDKLLTPCSVMNLEMDKYVEDLDVVGNFVNNQLELIDLNEFETLDNEEKKEWYTKRDDIHAIFLLTGEEMSKKFFYKDLDKKVPPKRTSNGRFYLCKIKNEEYF